jgi:hypothetical protein
MNCLIPTEVCARLADRDKHVGLQARDFAD